MKKIAPLLLLLAAGPAPQPAAQPAPSPNEIVAAAPAADWVAIAASDLLVMDLAPDAKGAARRVVIQLMPPPFSKGWVGNIRKLAAAHWWDGTSINRVQDNYVVQWGDASEKKPLLAGLAKLSEGDYVSPGPVVAIAKRSGSGSSSPSKADVYAATTGFYLGFPTGSEQRAGRVSRWPVHCYGMVGVGRNLSPDTGSGAELYTVIGHAPRHLDRNIALVGRVIAGIEHLSSLPRGTGTLGFYEKDEERVSIRSVRLASELEADPLLKFEYLSTESKSFAAYAEARANRRDAFFIRPAGGADICNIPVPVRPIKAR